MDEFPSLGSLDTSTLLRLLSQERSRRAELEQEVIQLHAGLARQNAVIIQLERRDSEGELAKQHTLMAALTTQNSLLRQQVA